ncbi:MAG: adenylate/guanylate cyclase domain-containing protein [Burkholderiales bacterium]|nr:adenylate/guanylate cyclase domain-containing protein [Burkholderiales bacterium]
MSSAQADAIPSESPPGSVAWAAGTLSRLRCVVLIADRVESVAEIERYGQAAAVQWAVWLHEVRSRLLPEAGARLVKSTGDGFMAQCGDPVAALRLAQRLHAAAASSTGAAGVPTAIRLRVAINLADVIADGVDLYGYDANVAARAMAMAEPGQTIVTEAVRDHLGAAPFADLEDLGECHLEHIANPVLQARGGQVASAIDGHGRLLASILFPIKTPLGLVGSCAVLTVAPTAPRGAGARAPAGRWTVEIRLHGNAAGSRAWPPAHAYLARNDADFGMPRRGRASHFVAGAASRPAGPRRRILRRRHARRSALRVTA